MVGGVALGTKRGLTPPTRGGARHFLVWPQENLAEIPCLRDACLLFGELLSVSFVVLELSEFAFLPHRHNSSSDCPKTFEYSEV